MLTMKKSPRNHSLFDIVNWEVYDHKDFVFHVENWCSKVRAIEMYRT